MWLRNEGRGKEYRVFRGPAIKRKVTGTHSAPRTPSTTDNKPDSASLDVNADPEVAYGAEVDSRQDANVNGVQGYAVRYSDGTIELYRDGSTAPWTYRPKPDSIGAYEFHDETGQKADNMIFLLKPTEIFETSE